MATRGAPVPPTQAVTITEVWSDNLEDAFAEIRDLADKYPYIAMDTEFPGVVARPMGHFKSTADYHFQTLRCNCDLLKVIQLGVTFADERGYIPAWMPTWQFNFKFSLSEDMYAQDSIDLLTRSGIQFKAHEERGVDPHAFAELLISSGLVLLDSVSWISFHSGYDFGYLLKLLTCAPLPSHEDAFFELLNTYFPNVYDIKHIARAIGKPRGGLQDLADELHVIRIGPQHQAGSDSLLTLNTFFALKEAWFGASWDPAAFKGRIYGISTYSQRSADLEARGSPPSAPPASASGSSRSARSAPRSPSNRASRAGGLKSASGPPSGSTGPRGPRRAGAWNPSSRSGPRTAFKQNHR